MMLRLRAARLPGVAVAGWALGFRRGAGTLAFGCPGGPVTCRCRALIGPGDRNGGGNMVQVAELPGGRAASYEVIGNGRPALMFAGGPGFTAAYMNGDAGLLSDVLRSCLIDPHGSGSSTPPADPAGYSPEGHARFYDQVRQALALPEVVVLGHSFGATTALTYAALFPDSTAMCVAVAAFGVGPDADAQQGGQAEAEAEALLARHAGSPWYEAARPVMDSWTERLLAATDAAEMEQMMATVLPFYLAEPRSRNSSAAEPLAAAG